MTRSNAQKAEFTAPIPEARNAHLAAYRYQPGQSGNPGGRPRGARSKLSELTLNKLLASFEQHGDDAIERVRINQPAAYLAAMVSLLPKQQEKLDSPFSDLTEDELNLLEHFLKSTRAKQVTTIDVTPDQFQAPDTGQSEGQPRGPTSEPSSAAVPPIPERQEPIA